LRETLIDRSGCDGVKIVSTKKNIENERWIIYPRISRRSCIYNMERKGKEVKNSSGGDGLNTT
jgi:hypothetical protein